MKKIKKEVEEKLRGRDIKEVKELLLVRKIIEFKLYKDLGFDLGLLFR